MALRLDPSVLAAIVGGSLLALLGAWMALRRPRRAEAGAAGAFIGLLGVTQLLFWGIYVFSPELRPSHVPLLWGIAVSILIGAWGAGTGLAVLTWLYARPVLSRHRWTVAVPAALGLLQVFHTLADFPWRADRARGPWGDLAPYAFDVANIWAFMPLQGAALFALLSCALRVQFADGAEGPAARKRLALSFAAGMFAFGTVGIGLARLAGQGPSYLLIPATRFPSGAADQLVFFTVLLLLWARFIARAYARRSMDVGTRRAAWAFLLVLLALAVAGAVAWTFGPPRLSYPLSWGIAFIVGATVLAYSILRHNVFGLDVKLRWTVSKTALAAFFVATFFIASEAAQQFFGERFGGPYVGILAAGALVFAITPLSRLADRLAMKAIPTVGRHPRAANAQEDTFRAAVKLTLRGGISAAEELELARIAEANGISPTRSVTLRQEVERDAASMPATRRGGRRGRPTANPGPPGGD